VKRVEIPKPDGGMRKLGIPTVLDRFIQQAVMQVIQEQWDRTFSEHSYGFRPGHNAHQAVAAAQQHIADGYRWVVDIDLEKFFDRVNHDRLMGVMAKRVEDKRLLRLIRAFLNAGVMENIESFISRKLKLKVNAATVRHPRCFVPWTRGYGGDSGASSGSNGNEADDGLRN